ncbi:MAG: site-specific DNA-methyltransferase, partial [Candidatus Hodarchaeales archaeon]
MKDHNILYGDVWACLSTIEDNSLDCAITSPPYWSQRDYGFDNQIGNEELLNDYLEKLTTIFNLLRTKLNSSGVFYLNIGDKYLTKYGNTPLGMIPYLLAYYLVLDGWNLEDVQIWNKLNHMPSSVKNRFTNTYEPIFVLSKAKKNYYSIYKQKDKTSNILKIPLQPVVYKHMATFPEKLVEALLKQGLPNEALILDPFAGSGTTCKAAQNLSEGYFNPIKMNSIMIESFKEYIKIIKNRCKISTNNIKKIPFVSYKPKRLAPNFNVPVPVLDTKSRILFDINSKSHFIRIFTETETFNEFLPILFNSTLYKLLDDDGLIFIGLPNHDIDKLYTMAQLNQYGWVVRNMIVVPKNNNWFPIFMLVKDIKSVKYKFNLDAARITHKISLTSNWENINFIGYRVEKSQSYYKNPESGIIIEI